MTTARSDNFIVRTRFRAVRSLHCPTSSVSERFGNIRQSSSESLQGRSPQQGVFVLLLAIALFIPTCRDEILRIFAEATVHLLSDTKSVGQRATRSVSVSGRSANEVRGQTAHSAVIYQKLWKGKGMSYFCRFRVWRSLWSIADAYWWEVNCSALWETLSGSPLKGEG